MSINTYPPLKEKKKKSRPSVIIFLPKTQILFIVTN